MWKSTFQTEAPAGARILRWKSAWYVQIKAKRPVGLSGSSGQKAIKDKVKQAGVTVMI